MPQQLIAIDSQKLDAIMSCGRLFNYNFNKSYRSISTPDYLERGALVHDMLETYYKLRKYRSRWRINNRSYQDIVRSCTDVGRFRGNKMQLPISEIEYTIEIFRQYTDLWENDGWDNIVSVERVASKVLYQSDDLVILYEGKIDLVLKFSQTIAVDHKHSQSRRDPNQLANQFKGYCWLLDTDTFVVNEIGFQKTVAPIDKFRRHTLKFTKEILEEWRESVIYYVNLALSWYKLNYFPPNFTSCDKFSGCQYKEICNAQPGEYREYKLDKNFRKEDWDIGAKHL